MNIEVDNEPTPVALYDVHPGAVFHLASEGKTEHEVYQRIGLLSVSGEAGAALLDIEERRGTIFAVRLSLGQVCEFYPETSVIEHPEATLYLFPPGHENGDEGMGVSITPGDTHRSTAWIGTGKGDWFRIGSSK